MTESSRPSVATRVAIVVGSMLLAMSTPASADDTHRYIVQFKHNEKFPNAAPLSELESAVPAGKIVKRNKRGKLLVAQLNEEEAQALRSRSEVESVEIDGVVSLSYTPNDTLLNDLTGFTGSVGIKALNAWDTSRGSDSALIAVVDTGVDYNHPDLVDNIWTNPGEVPNNNVDDDGNGLVDDYRGYDFAGEDPDPMDKFGHGTHVAGTIAATGDNGAGVIGVAWKSKIIPLKAMSDSGYGSYFDIIQAVDYAVKLKESGVPIAAINFSIAGTEFSGAWYRAIQRARDADIVVVAAAGNSSANADRDPQYPAAFNLPNVISVAAIDSQGRLASFSNFGRRTVDMAAPGVDILSTYPTDDPDGPYTYKSGTSMASPQVAGIAALVAAANPSITKRQVRARILATVSPLASLSRTTATGGTADADAAVKTSLSVARSLEVYGTVKNGSSTLAGVSIRARATDGSGAGGRTTSKSDGTFILAGLTPGTYVVTASKTGTRFRRRSYEVNLSKDSKLSFAVAR